MNRFGRNTGIIVGTGALLFGGYYLYQSYVQSKNPHGIPEITLECPDSSEASPLIPGEPFHFAFSIKNAGDYVDVFTIEFFLGGKWHKYMDTRPLSPGQRISMPMANHLGLEVPYPKAVLQQLPLRMRARSSLNTRASSMVECLFWVTGEAN